MRAHGRHEPFDHSVVIQVKDESVPSPANLRISRVRFSCRTHRHIHLVASSNTISARPLKLSVRFSASLKHSANCFAFLFWITSSLLHPSIRRPPLLIGRGAPRSALAETKAVFDCVVPRKELSIVPRYAAPAPVIPVVGGGRTREVGRLFPIMSTLTHRVDGH